MEGAGSDDHRRILREEWIEFDVNMRKVLTSVSSAALIASLPVATLSPRVQEFLGLSFPTAAMILFPAALVVLLATGAYHRWGFDSKIYRALDHLETATIQCACGAASLLSTNATPVFWFFQLVHLMVLGFHPVFGIVRRWVIFVVPVGVVVLALVREGLSARVVLAAFALVLGSLVWDLASGFRKRMTEVIVGRLRVEAQLAELKIEGERARIARELHDGLAADLTAIAWRAEVSGEASANDTRGEFLAIAQRARAAIDDTKIVVWALREDSIDWATLAGQVRGRCADLCGVRAELDLTFEGPGDGRVPGAMAVDLLRMAQESVRNALQHGAPRRIRVRLHWGDTISLVVEDDGSGLPAEAGTAPGHRGLRNLERRTADHRGVLQIESLEPGTRITIKLPHAPLPLPG